MSISGPFTAILVRDVKVALRSGGGWFHALLFYGLFAGLSALAFGPELSALSEAAPAVIWLAAALAVQFAVADIFARDVADGFLYAISAEEESLFGYYAAKASFVAAAIAAPVVLATPLVMAMFGAGPGSITGAAMLAIGLPGLIFLSLFTAAIAAGLQAGGMLAIAISAPLVAPVLIFGVIATEKLLASQVFWSPEAMFLAALTLILGAAMPLFTIAALRAALE
ncbi:MAG: heme exporter protein CcmB [Pseudomonadota bacterium]